MIAEIQEKFGTEQTVTYTLLKDGKFYIIEHVPARVDAESGEQYFSPQTMERLQQMIWGQRKPIRVLQTPVYQSFYFAPLTSRFVCVKLVNKFLAPTTYE